MPPETFRGLARQTSRERLASGHRTATAKDVMNNRTQPLDVPSTSLADLGYQTGCVALSFDDGPHSPWTDGILDILERAGLPATFFVLGSRIAGHERLLRRMVDLECTVEIHSWSHTRLTEQSSVQRSHDICRTRELIQEVTGHVPTLVRPPEGLVSVEVLDEIAAVGLTPVFWSVHAEDWLSPGVPAIENGVVSGLDDGAIVLLHDGGGDRAQTVAALPRIIATIGDLGLRAVSLSAAHSGHDRRDAATRT